MTIELSNMASAGFLPDRARGRPHLDPRAPGGSELSSSGSVRFNGFEIPALTTPGRDDGRARLRPELHDRRPAPQPQQQLDRPGALPRQHPIIGACSARRATAARRPSCDRRDALSGAAVSANQIARRPTAIAIPTRRSACCSARPMPAAAASSVRGTAAEPRTVAPGVGTVGAVPAGGERGARQCRAGPRGERASAQPASTSDDRPRSKGRQPHVSFHQLAAVSALGWRLGCAARRGI